MSVNLNPPGMKDASYWIQHLEMEQHPEGGYYKRTYQSGGMISTGLANGMRPFGTAIYYLLQSYEVSKFHKLKWDELWHFYDGSPIVIHQIDTSGKYTKSVLGRNPDNGEQLQLTVKANTWLGATVIDKGHYSLVGCTMAPGFHFDDFILGEKEYMLKLYPDHYAIIERLT